MQKTGRIFRDAETMRSGKLARYMRNDKRYGESKRVLEEYHKDTLS